MTPEEIIALARKISNSVGSHATPDLFGEGQIVAFFHAAIESYKAELLKEVGEPFGYMMPHYEEMHPIFRRHPLPKGHSPLFASETLYTSYQVAAAIIKATKPLEDQLAAAQEENGRLENQVLARDAELWSRTQEILGLKDQLAKAEQRVAEWQPISTATKDGTYLCLGHGGTPFICLARNGEWFRQSAAKRVVGLTHLMHLPKAPNGASS